MEGGDKQWVIDFGTDYAVTRMDRVVGQEKTPIVGKLVDREKDQKEEKERHGEGERLFWTSIEGGGEQEKVSFFFGKSVLVLILGYMTSARNSST